MEKPYIIAVDDDPEALQRIRSELDKRYAADYDIDCDRSPRHALELLDRLKNGNRQVAVLLADCNIPEMAGVDFLQEARSIFPDARRGLLINWGDSSAGDVILHAVAVGIIDGYSPKPWISPDENFHVFVTNFLEDWARLHRPKVEMVRIIGEQWASRCHELRDLLNRNDIPYGFYDLDSKEGKSLSEKYHLSAEAFPATILLDGQVLHNPTNTELAEALHVNTVYDMADIPTDQLQDLVVVGAGPAGLSTAVYAASEGLSTVVIEREAIGGQAGTSSRIRNYLGFPTGISGDELASRAYRQAWLFGADFTFTHEVVELRVEDGAKVITLSDGQEIRTRSVVLAMGVRYRRLQAPGISELEGRGVFYGAATSEAMAMRGRQVYVAGGGNSAGQAIVHLSKYAGQATLLVRSDSLAESMSDYLVKEIEACNNVEVHYNTEIVAGGGAHRLEWLELRQLDQKETQRVPADALFALIGAQPHTGWLPDQIITDDAGFILTGRDLSNHPMLSSVWHLERKPFLLESSIPGVFVAGDVRHASVKRVASAVGEGSMAVQFVHKYLSELPDVEPD